MRNKFHDLTWKREKRQKWSILIDVQKDMGEKIALWFRTALNRDVSNGQLACPIVRSLVPLTYLLAPHCSLCSRALLRSFICSHTHSQARGKVNDWYRTIRVSWTIVYERKDCWHSWDRLHCLTWRRLLVLLPFFLFCLFVNLFFVFFFHFCPLTFFSLALFFGSFLGFSVTFILSKIIGCLSKYPSPMELPFFL